MSDFSKDYPLYDNDDDYNKTSFGEYTSGNIQMMLIFILFLSFCSSFMHTFNDCIKCIKYRYNRLKLPVYRVNSNDNLLLDECSICLERYVVNDKIIHLNCRHSFHKYCLNEWLKNNNTCPQCRENII